MKSIKNERIGISMMMNCGMKATIIAYRQYSDIDIQFEDGTIVKHKRYDHFKTGAIKFPENINPHIGETIKHKDHTYTIKKWRSNHDIDFVRDDGILYEHKTYYRFKHSSSFKNNNYSLKNHIGERKKMNCSEFATIINCANGRVTIKFDDGTIRENIQYNNFKRGMVCKNPHNKKDRIGEKKLMSNGQSATIICYRKSDDIDIQFEDGYIKKSISYSSFKSGFVQNPNKLSKNAVKLSRRFDKSKYIGKVNLMNCGISCKIIDAIGTSSNLTVQFENGEIREGVSYSEFSNGCLLPKSGMAFCRLLEENIMNNGQTARIIEYRNSQDIDVQFEDGSIVEHVQYTSFKIGRIKNHNDINPKSNRNKYLGMEHVMNNGMKAKIIKYRNARDIEICFQDGEIVHSTTINSFLKGEILHPIIGKSYIRKNREKELIGTTKVLNNGMRGTIVAYKSANNVTVKFEDGCKVKTNFYMFKEGRVEHPIYVRRHESYNELFVASYFEQIGFKKIKRTDTKKIDSSLEGIEFDLYNNINGHKIAIEYDGGHWGHNQKKDMKKNILCKKNNIMLIRIREPQLEKYDQDGVKQFYLETAELGSENLKILMKDILAYIQSICDVKLYIDFNKNATIKTPDSYQRTGKMNVMKNGMQCTIITYRNASNIDVQFEDGTIVKHKTFKCFQRGNIANPNISIKDKRIGMSLTMNCGMKATIIDYRNSQDIDVQFEDGTIVEHIAFARFKKGELKKSIKDKRIGMSLTMNCGMKATIIDYHNCSDINVQFEDGTVVKHRAFAQFKNKQIANPNILIIRPNPLKDKRKGMSLMMNCDMKATIIAYRNSQDIDIQFEDGIIVKHKAFDSFQKGKIANPNISIKDKRIGQSLMMSCGMKATIIAYRNCNDIDVQFEDGTIVKHKRIGNFRGGHIANPNIKINPNIISL